VQAFKNHANRIREYISDPGIGYDKVERIINAAHALRFQTSRVIGEKRLSEQDKKKRIFERYSKPKGPYSLLDSVDNQYEFEPKIKKKPVEPEEDLLLFIYSYGRLSDWERDILNIVREETLYFIPQIETKIMNEGWASYWHYKILNKLELPQGLHVEFIKRHNQVIRPHRGSINPYYLGFKMFKEIKERYSQNPEKIFEIREIERDESFIRRYLTYDLCKELNLFEYIKIGKDYIISDVSDEEGWKKVRDTIAASAGMGSIPVIKIEEWVQKDSSLILRHEHDGRDLELNYASETLKYLADLWDGKVILQTIIEGKSKDVICSEDKRVSIKQG